MSKFVFGKNSLKNREGVHPDLIRVDDLAITLTLVDFGHGEYSGLRTAEDQNHLHKKGVSPNCDGFKVKSLHQSGRALDFHAHVEGRGSWKEDHLTMVACAYFQAASILGIKIKWGGLWKGGKTRHGIQYGWDCPHIQLA